MLQLCCLVLESHQFRAHYKIIIGLEMAYRLTQDVKFQKSIHDKDSKGVAKDNCPVVLDVLKEVPTIVFVTTLAAIEQGERGILVAEALAHSVFICGIAVARLILVQV